MLFDQFLGPFWDLFGTILDIKIASKNQSKNDIVLGSFWGRKMVPKWSRKVIKNRPGHLLASQRWLASAFEGAMSKI